MSSTLGLRRKHVCVGTMNKDPATDEEHEGAGFVRDDGKIVL
jgi:hypothetical protein